MENQVYLEFVNVKKSYFEHIRKSDDIVREYINIHNIIDNLKVPSSASIQSQLFIEKTYKNTVDSLSEIKCKIRILETMYNNWRDETYKIYTNIDFPPNLDQPDMLANYINQQNFLLNRLNQLTNNLMSLYNSINIKSGEVQDSIDRAKHNKQFYIALLLTVISILVGIYSIVKI